jgi:transcriptional regulator with XRE-family HTH domain
MIKASPRSNAVSTYKPSDPSYWEPDPGDSAIKQARKSRRLTVKRLSKQTGISRPTIMNWEAGRLPVRAIALLQALSAVGLSCGEMLVCPQSLRSARERESIEPEHLAEVVGVSVAILERWEQGQSLGRLMPWIRLLDHLGVTAKDVLNDRVRHRKRATEPTAAPTASAPAPV